MLLRLVYAAIVLVALYLGYGLWANHHALRLLHDGPFNSAVGPAKPREVIVELMDYRCEGCRLTHPVVEEFRKKHPDVRFVFRHMPVYKRASVNEAKMALAAGKQGKFMEMHNLLIVRDKPVEDKEIDGIASSLGLDVARFHEDMKSKEIARVVADTLGASRRLHVGAIPMFIIRGKMYASTERLITVADLEKMLTPPAR